MFWKVICMTAEAIMEMMIIIILAWLSVSIGQPLIGNLFLLFGVLVIGGNFLIRLLLLSTGKDK